MRHRFLLPIVSLVFAGLTIFLGYCVQRSDFQVFISAYAAFFGLYVWVVFYAKKHWSAAQMRHLIWLGIALRVLLLFSIPNLSDDYARFLWDGHLSVAGIHPFVHTPKYFIENQLVIPGITQELFAKLNSQEYFTVYPPVCQAAFAMAAWVFPTSVLGGVFLMKLFLLGCEIGTIWILEDRRALTSLIPPKSVAHLKGVPHLYYALNPLVVLEITGNCHFEGAMIFFLLAGMVALQNGKIAKGAIWWALATASKLLPLLFLPIVWRWLGFRKGLIFNILFAIFSLLLFAPVLAVLPNILESIDLYFRQFQFNASIYYLVREIGFLKYGWDIGEFSGPALGVLTLLGVLVIAWFTPQKDGQSGKIASLETAMLFALFLYLSVAATVQPWYLAVPLALSLFTHWRFMLVWSGLAALSYSHYQDGEYQEQYALIVLEYVLLWAFFLWECWRIFVQKPAQVST